MNILAVDTSTKHLGIGISASGDRRYHRRYEEEGHSSPLFPRIRQALDSIALDAGAVELLAVVSGPGSFTGLRIGMAGLFGWAAARNLPVQPVGVFDTIRTGLDGTSPALIVVHSRGAEFHTMLVRDGIAIGPRVQRLREALKMVSDETLICGPGAVEFVRQGTAIDGKAFRCAPSELLQCDMLAVCALAEKAYRSDPGKADKLEIEPFYMTLSQAQINFERDTSRTGNQ